jgi:hypothetical protein
LKYFGLLNERRGSPSANTGSIIAQGVSADGVGFFETGGTVINGHSGSTAGAISGYHLGIFANTAGSPSVIVFRGDDSPEIRDRPPDSSRTASPTIAAATEPTGRFTAAALNRICRDGRVGTLVDG